MVEHTIGEQKWIDEGRGHKIGSGVGSNLAPSTPEQVERWWLVAERAWGKPREAIIQDFQSGTK